MMDVGVAWVWFTVVLHILQESCGNGGILPQPQNH